MGSQEAHGLLHRRQPRRLPATGPGPGLTVPHEDRASPDRRPRRSQAAVGHWAVRSGVLLLVVAAGAPPGEPQPRQRPAPLPQPLPDLRRLRPTAVLPPLRARLLHRESQAVPERGEDRPHGQRAGAGAVGGYLPRARPASLRRQHAPRSHVVGAQGGGGRPTTADPRSGRAEGSCGAGDFRRRTNPTDRRGRGRRRVAHTTTPSEAASGTGASKEEGHKRR